MPPDVVERVTERFFRADPSRSRQRGGSGLGLAIVDAAVTAHGGTIDITSTPGHGTSVRLSFPSAIAPNTASPVPGVATMSRDADRHEPAHDASTLA